MLNGLIKIHNKCKSKFAEKYYNIVKNRYNQL